MNQAAPTMIVPSLISEGSVWLAFGALAGLAYLPVAADGATAAAVLRFGSQGMMIMCLLYLHERVLAATGLAERLRRVPFAAAWTVGSVLSTAVRGRSAAVRVLALDRVRSRTTNAEASRERTPQGTMPTVGAMS